jgi:hypothetical protein
MSLTLGYFKRRYTARVIRVDFALDLKRLAGSRKEAQHVVAASIAARVRHRLLASAFRRPKPPSCPISHQRGRFGDHHRVAGDRLQDLACFPERQCSQKFVKAERASPARYPSSLEMCILI